MKLVKRLTAAIIALAVAAPCAAFAANVIYYDADLAKVTYSVDTTEVVMSAVASEDAVPANIVYIGQPAGNGSAAADTFTMPDLVSVSGKYTVNVVAGDGTQIADLSFWHINPDDAAAGLAAIDAAATAADVATAITNNAAGLGVDPADDIAGISNYLVNMKKDTAMTAAEFSKNYRYAKILNALNGATEAVVTPEILKPENASLLGIDTVAYTGYAQDVKNAVAARFAAGTFDAGSDLKAEVAEWIALARFNDAEAVATAQELLVTTYASLFGLDTTAYNASSYKEDIVSDVMSLRPFGTKETLASTFATESSKSRGGGGSGGSSSGGSSSGGSSSGSDSGTAIVIPADTSVISSQKLVDIGGHWAETTIDDLYRKGIVKGSENRFYPNKNISRAEFCTLIVQAFYNGKTGSTDEFLDVTPDNWYYSYVGFLNAKGIVSGMGDGTFGAGRNITRQDMAAIIARVMKDLGTSTTAVREMAAFTDAADIAPYSVEAVEMLYTAGIVSGYEGGNFNPTANLTKAEAATVIYKLLNK